MRQVTIVTLPKEVAESIMSWIHPKEVWSLRSLSKTFQALLMSRTFIRLNISRFVPPVRPRRKSSLADRNPTKWDLMFSAAPAPYMEEYVRKHISHSLNWAHDFVATATESDFRAFPTAWFQYCSNLTEFRGYECFKGEIPPEIGTLTSLRELELECNRLIGEIPASIGNLINLTTLHLFENDGICGPVPPEIGLLKSLVSLSISGEELRGPIPVELCNLQNLKMLQLKFGVDFKTPTYFIPELGELKKLEHLDLASCGLVGPIPREIANLVCLKNLDLFNNWLSGDAPLELLELPQLVTCRLSENEFLVIPFLVPAHWEIGSIYT